MHDFRPLHYGEAFFFNLFPGYNDSPGAPLKPPHPITPSRLLIPLGIGLILCLFGDATLYTVLPKADIMLEAGIGLGMVGIVLGANRLIRILSNGPAGWLYDRLPRRWLMIASLVLGAISTACYALSHGSALLLAGRILWGIAWSGLWIGTTAMTLDISREDNRGFVNGQLQMWYFLAVAIASFSSGLFTDLLGYRGGLWLSAGFGLLAALVWLVFLPETRPGGIKVPEKKSTKANTPLPWKIAISLTVPYFTMRIVFEGVLAATTILWLEQFIDGSLTVGTMNIPLATLTGIFTAIRVVVSILSAPWVGKLSDHLRRRWAVLAGVIALGVLGLWGMSLPDFGLSVASGLVSAVTAGAIPLLIPAVVGDRVPEEQHGRTLGFIFSWGDLGSGLGPSLGLALIPMIGIGGTYQLCALLLLITGFFSFYMASKESLIVNTPDK
jgi:DHA1 family multidrug resistance protein-like MFS transporter